MIKMMKIINKQQGFGLLEVLVSMAVLSIGLLGMVGLQLLTLKNAYNSHLRSQATILISSMADKIRANKAGIDNYNNINIATLVAGSAPVDNCYDETDVTKICSVADMAKADAYEWSTEVNNALPNADGNIDCAVNVCTISLSWDERESDPDDPSSTGIVNKEMTMEFEL